MNNLNTPKKSLSELEEKTTKYLGEIVRKKTYIFNFYISYFI